MSLPVLAIAVALVDSAATRHRLLPGDISAATITYGLNRPSWLDECSPDYQRDFMAFVRRNPWHVRLAAETGGSYPDPLGGES